RSLHDALPISTAVLSRCVAGILDRPRAAHAEGSSPGPSSAGLRESCPKHAFPMTLPGSRGGLRDGLEVLDGVREHLLDQLAGGGGHGAEATQGPAPEPRRP